MAPNSLPAIITCNWVLLRKQFQNTFIKKHFHYFILTVQRIHWMKDWPLFTKFDTCSGQCKCQKDLLIYRTKHLKNEGVGNIGVYGRIATLNSITRVLPPSWTWCYFSVQSEDTEIKSPRWPFAEVEFRDGPHRLLLIHWFVQCCWFHCNGR